MAAKGVELCILCLLCSGAISGVGSATLKASVSPDPGLKGPRESLTVRCSFSAGSGETLRVAELWQGDGTTVIASLVPGDPSPSWDNGAGLSDRGYLQGSMDSNHLTMVLNDTRCSDDGVVYLCALRYRGPGDTPMLHSNVTVHVQAHPQPPSAMMVQPPLPSPPGVQNVTQFTLVTFTCTANVGSPPTPTFLWFKVTGQDGPRLPVSAESVVQGNATASVQAGEECTYTRSSQLRLNVTGTDPGRPLTLLCALHPALPGLDPPTSRPCLHPDTHFCQTSPPLNVQYPVSVTEQGPVAGVEGTDVVLTCSMRGNPQPHLVEWRREGENETLSSSSSSSSPSSSFSLTVRNASLDDAGSYICTAHNSFGGADYEASAVVLLSVDKATTPAPPTTPTPSQTSVAHEDSAEQAGLGEKEVIIIVVVLVALVVIVAIGVAVVIVRKRRAQKEFDDSPVKSANSQPEGNNMALQHDPVASGDHGNVAREDGLTYADLQFDNQPRSRRPLAIDDTHTEYADISMPQV